MGATRVEKAGSVTCVAGPAFMCGAFMPGFGVGWVGYPPAEDVAVRECRRPLGQTSTRGSRPFSVATGYADLRQWP